MLPVKSYLCKIATISIDRFKSAGIPVSDSIQVCFLMVLLARLICEDISPSSKSYAHNVYVFAGGRGVVITYCVMVLLLISQP